MLTKEKEAMVRAARNLQGSMLIEAVKEWKRGDLSDKDLLESAGMAVQGVIDIVKALEPKVKPSDKELTL